jgi:hypothetical protein
VRGVELPLKGATLALAGAAIYLTTLVVAERGRADSAAEQRPSLEAQVRNLESARSQSVKRASLASSAAAPASPVRASAPSAAPANSAPEGRGSFALPGPTLQEQLARLADPTMRATMLQIRKSRERELLPGLRQELRLSPEEENEFLAVIGEQDLRTEEREIRDALEDRRSSDEVEALDSDLQQRLAALLGEERSKRWDDYQATLPERRNVIDLRSRLGENASLSEAASRQLTEAMHDERVRFAAETRKLSGSKGYDDSPERARLNSEDLPARLKFREEQIARTAEYYARIRERAAAFLSVQQLQRLEDLHESNLANLRANLVRGRSVETEMNRLRAAAPAEH